MKIEIIVCDDCGRRITEPATDLVTVKVTRRDSITTRELCPACGTSVVEMLKTHTRQTPKERPDLAADLHDGVVEARRIANAGLERYAEGANADELAQVLRDVSSAARRR